MRPFYNIAHHCNTEKEVNEAVERHGANAIECDITPIISHKNKIKFKVYHPWDFLEADSLSALPQLNTLTLILKT